MKPRTTLILALVLVVLAAAATLFETNRRKSLSSAGGPIFPAYRLEKADAIEVDGGGRHVELKKSGENWLVVTEGSHPADPKLPKQILEAIEKFTTSTLISTSTERQTAFEVDSTGYTVRVHGGGKSLAAFVVGKSGPDFMSTYVRPVEKTSVYLVPIYLRTSVDRGDQSWRNMTLLEVEQADIRGYTTRNLKESVSVERQDDGTWQITEPIQARARADIMSSVLRSLATIRASGFADSTLTAAAAGLDPDTTSVVIRTADGSSHTIVIGSMNDARQSYTVRQGDPQIYLVPRGRWNTVMRPSETLKEAAEGDLSAPPPAPALPGGR
jgi:hypothetical protein